MAEPRPPAPGLREIDVDDVAVPMALATLHRELEAGAEVGVRLAAVEPARRDDLVVGAGFRILAETDTAVLRLRRLLTLPDTVGSHMRVLVCGLNPSVHAAEAGIGFARPGNRFWPAALAARLVSVDRDPDHAITVHGLGMTDLAKRATPRAADLERHEYLAGLARLERLAGWLRPGVVCFVGLSGWRAAADPAAVAGPQDRRVGGCPVYLMPSTSGLNAHARLSDLTDHLAAAGRLAESQDRPG